MKLAVVAPSGAPRDASRLTRHAHALVPLLRARCDVTVFDVSGVGGALGGQPLQELEPRAFEQILWLVADDPLCAPLWQRVRALGGTVALFEWNLARAACAAFPELAAGGPRAAWVALREGGGAAVRCARDGTLLASLAGAAGRAPPPALNRAIVRHADCFLVPSDDLRQRIRADRNEPTPIAVMPWDVERDACAVADAWLAALRAFPTHRTARKSVVRSMLESLGGGPGRARDAAATE